MRMSSPLQAMPPPLRNLTRFLLQSHGSTGRINIPAKSLQDTKKHLSTRPIIPIHHVEEIVASIDAEEPTICARLDLQGFLLVYQILSLTEECLAYHRGLSLLTQSLHEASGSSLAERDLRANKKIHLGKTALDFLVGCFVRAELTNRTRRWMGILALELLQQCDKNKQLLLKASKDTWRCLGDLVFDGACHTLKMTAGLIIHEMWPNNTPTKELWPPPRDPEIYRRFPKATARTSQWILDFEKFAKEQGSRSRSERETPDAVLAHAISIGELTYCVEGESTILVAVSDEMSIVIPASSTGTAKYVDIDIDQIQGVSSGGGQLESLVVLTIWFSNAMGNSFFVNALGEKADSINIAFTSSEAAATVQKILANRITNCPRASQSEPVDISLHFFGEINGSAGTAPVTRFSGDLVTAASEASALLARDPMGLPDLAQNAEDELRYHLQQLDQSRVEAQSSHQTILDTQEPTPLVDCAMSPIDTQQFCEAVISPHAKPRFQPDKVETPKRVTVVGRRQRSPLVKSQLTSPSMSIPVTPRSRINKRERYRAATNEAPQTSLRKLSRKSKARRNEGEQPLSFKSNQKTRKDAKPPPSPVSRPRRAAALSADKKIQDIIESESSELEEVESITNKATAPVRRNHKSGRHQGPSSSSGTNEGSKRGSASSKDKAIQFQGDNKKASTAINFTKAASRGLGKEKAENSDDNLLPDQLVQEAPLVSLSDNNEPRLMPLIAPTHIVNQVDKAHGTMLTKSSPEPLQEQDFIQRNVILNSTVDLSDSFLEETTAPSCKDVTNISRKLKKREIPETPARESKHANAKDTDPHGISTSLSIATKLQSALSSVIDIRPKANTRALTKLEAFQLSATTAPQSPKKALEEDLPERENGDLSEGNTNSNRKKRPQPLEVRSNPSNWTALQIRTISDKPCHVNQASGDADCKPFEEFRTLDDDKENRSAKKHVKTPLDVDRKCNIISFDSKGPRNQGISSSQKPRRGLVPRCPSPELSTSVKVTGLKRKGQGDYDSGTNLEKHAGSPAKRPRQNVEVTRTRDSASRRGLKRDSSNKQTAHKASSQSTRVDANGSPLPFIHSRKINLARPAIQPNPLRDTDSGCHDCVMHAHNLRKSNCGFLSPQARPSLPSAQFFQAYKAHKLHPRGNSIDTRSHDVLEDARPLPFVDLYRDGLKNFMDMLQRSSKNSCEQDISAFAATTNQDRERTLAKVGFREEQISSSICSQTSSSLHSSAPSSYSGGGSSDDPSSSGGGDGAGGELAAEFQPHQVETLEVLFEISLSVVRNLACKEKGLKELACSYRLGGNRLIEEVEKSRQQDILASQGVIDSVKHNLAGIYKRTQQHLEAGLAASLKGEPAREKDA